MVKAAGEKDKERIEEKRSDCLAKLLRGGLLREIGHWEVEQPGQCVIFRACDPHIPESIKSLKIPLWEEVAVLPGVLAGNDASGGFFVKAENSKKAGDAARVLELQDVCMAPHARETVTRMAQQAEEFGTLITEFGSAEDAEFVRKLFRKGK